LQTPQSGCGSDKFIRAEIRALTSDNYPNNYSNNKVCEWRLEAGSNHYILIKVVAFNLENQSTCNYDEVVFDYGGSATEKYCDVLQTPQFRAYQNHAQTVRFKTDGSVVRSGFKMYWYKYPSILHPGNVHTTTACDGGKSHRMEMSGSIQTLGSQYVDNLDCSWYIGRHINDRTVYELRITQFAVEAQSNCGYDFLSITAPYVATDQPKPGICDPHCCDGKVDFTVGRTYTFAGVIRVRFKTDRSVQRNGWKLEWRAQSGSPGRMAGRSMTKAKVYPGYKDYEPEIPFKDVWLENHWDEVKDIPILENFEPDELDKPSGEMIGGPWNQKYIPSWQRDKQEEARKKEEEN